MERTYELALVVDGRVSEEENVEIVDAVKALVNVDGVTISKEESWGKKTLAYPINKATEGYYTFLYLVARDVTPPVREVEMRMTQNDNVLRYLTVRTDEDLHRAVRKGKKFVPAAAAVGIGPSEPPAEQVESAEVATEEAVS